MEMCVNATRLTFLEDINWINYVYFLSYTLFKEKYEAL